MISHMRGFSLIALALLIGGCDPTAPTPRYAGTFVLISAGGRPLPYLAHVGTDDVTIVADTLAITAVEQDQETVLGDFSRRLVESATQGGVALSFSGKALGGLSGDFTFIDASLPFDQSLDSGKLSGNTLTAQTNSGATFIYTRR
jgi:hypothetical protein